MVCLSKVYTLADHLKYFDPVFERMLYEATGDDGSSQTNAITLEDQPWLQELQTLLKQTNVKSFFFAVLIYINFLYYSLKILFKIQIHI